ncbi:MAG: T9SS type A sorting domain-containing protein, partial [Rhodothermales bacterium]|nr:T9SS type A sorting domain-containing protein [Rhodothermales bacterium]
QEIGPNGHIAVDRDGPGVGYHVMAARENRGGSQTLAAFERDNWGWIDCLTLARDTTVEIKDLYTGASSNCVKLRLRDEDTSFSRLYLSNHQHVGPFDTLRTEGCYGVRSDHGLMTTGLLASRVSNYRTVAIIPADNRIDLGLTSATYDGDMFGPQSPQLTPWTTPSIQGYLRHSDRHVLTDGDFVAIDNIRYHEADPSVMVLDFRSDFRHNSTFRSDSRIGPESSGVTLSGEAVVTNGSQLETATDINVAGSLTVRTGSSVFVGSQSTLAISDLHMEPGATIVVKGVLEIQDLFGDPDDIRTAGGAVSISHVHELTQATGFAEADYPGGDTARADLEDADTDISLNVYPNPFSTTLFVDITTESSATIDVHVFDVLGRLVAQPVRGESTSAGSFQLAWNPRGLSRATYFVRITAGGRTKVVPVTYAP